MDHCVRGHSLLWVSREREVDMSCHVMSCHMTTLSCLDLSPLIDTPQLTLGSDTIPSSRIFSWGLKRRKPPATIRCPLSSGCIDITLATDLSLLGLAFYGPANGWNTVVKAPKGVCTLPAETGTPLYYKDSVYACVQGQLVRVDLSALKVERLSLALCAQPQLSLNRDALVLNTPTGSRMYPLSPAVMAGEYPVERTPFGNVVGSVVGAAVVAGVGEVGGRCFDVTRSVWTSLGQEYAGDLDTVEHVRHSVKSIKQLDRMLASGVAERVDVTCTDGTMSTLCPIQCIENRQLHDWTFTNCSFASLCGASITNSRFINCSFKGANLAHTSVTSCTLTDCRLDGAALEGSVLTDVVFGDGCSMVGCGLAKASLTAVSLCGVPLTNCDLSEASFKEVDIAGCDVTGVSLSGHDLSHTRGLSNTMLHQSLSVTGVNLSGHNMASWDLSRLDLTSAVFDRTDLSGADLTGACLEGVSFERSTFTSACLRGVSGLRATHLQQVRSVVGIVLTGQRLAGWDLTGLDLTEARLTGCDLSDTNLSGSCLKDVDMTDAVLSGATLTDATGLECSQLISARCVTGIDVSGLNMEGWDLCTLDVRAADFSDVQLKNASLPASIFAARNVTQSQLRSGSFTRSRFCDTDLTKRNLSGLCLSGSNLADTRLVRCDLSQTDVTGANMTGTILTGANLRGVVGLSDTQLHSAASVTRAVFVGLNLAHRDLSTINFQSADFTNADLSGADLTGCNLDGACLKGATLTGATLTGVNGFGETQLQSVAGMTGANLSGLDLSGMDLMSVSLRDTDLRECNLTGTVLSAHCGAIVPFSTVPSFDRPVERMPYDTYSSVTLIVPALEGLKWCLSMSGRLELGWETRKLHRCKGTGALLHCKRSGTTIKLSGPVGSASVRCTPGMEARVELRMYERDPRSGSTVVVEM
ncbi:hypothetical protein KIPB_010202 [Kipferlia bialata]|uniref:Low-complexity protein n=1 Tax=Kipferlia bialata TaxID=797122 RepID=A0A391P5P6_9EUKA|nr:hypothetical protein KIPB_010202 [Kipferlia bialata]|eukprot:g10202.t1